MSGMENLAPVEVLNDEQYERPSERKPIPEDGEYILKLPTTFPDDAFGEDKRKGEEHGHLQLQIDPVIVATGDGEDTPHRNYQIRYQRASVRIFPWRKSSQVVDLLFAIKAQNPDFDYAPSDIPRDPRQAKSWLREALAGQTFRAFCRAECGVKLRNGSYVNLRGREDFDAEVLRSKLYKNGASHRLDAAAEGFQRAFPSPWELDKTTQQPKILFANFRVAAYKTEDSEDA